ncbi:hypothetical protein JCM11491_005600 [Sporobolomyces phaffii]
MTTLRPRTRRWKRPNFWLGKLIPGLLVLFGYSGYRLVLLDVYPLIKSRDARVAYAYMSWVNSMLVLVAYSYSRVYFHGRDSSPGDTRIPQQVQARRVVFACDQAGLPLRCFLDDCNGRFLSIRTRHCRDCGTCRPGFDHHCSFMDNCVATSSTFKPFVNFLLYAVLLLVVALVPLVPLQLRAFREVVATTWRTERMHREWWSRWYSWAGGPVWRYAGALVRGYAQYPSVAHDRAFLVDGHRVETLVRDGVTYAYDVPLYPNLATPTLSTLAIVVFATLIVGIGIAMLVVVVLNARKGMSAVEVERARRHRLASPGPPPSSRDYDARLRLWIPLPDDPGEANTQRREAQGAVVLVEPGTALFDFGPERNWKNLMGQHWLEWFIPTRIP